MTLTFIPRMTGAEKTFLVVRSTERGSWLRPARSLDLFGRLKHKQCHPVYLVEGMTMRIRLNQAANAAAVVGLLAMSGVVLAQDQKMKASAADQHFAMEAAQGGMAEVKLGQLAKDKGSSDAVKQFGQRMVDDHSKAGDQLKSAASQSGITLPSDVGPKHQAMIDKMSKLSGAEFDRAYTQAMLKDHKQDVADFQKEAKNGQDPNLKKFASETLPTLQSHLQMIQEISKGGNSADRMKKSDSPKMQ